MATRTIRAIVEVQVSGVYTEEALRIEVARLVIGKLEAPAGARLNKRSVAIKSYAKTAAADKRHHPANRQINEMRSLVSEMNDRICRLENNG